MKKALFSLIVLITILFSSLPQKVNASWTAAGEMYYTWLSDSTYRVYVRYYRTCTGIPSNTSITCCISNSCATTTYTFPLYAVTGSSVIVPASCPSYPNKCISPSSIIPGYQSTLFYGDVTLPYRCSSWKFSAITPEAAESSQNAAGGNVYLEAMINNTGSYQGNSSPYVPVNGIQFVCNSYTASYNNNATDANNDSLATEVMAALDGNTCGPASHISFKTLTPILRLPDNPFQTNNTFICDPASGVMSFTPGNLGNQYIGVKIKEFRNGVFIGYITRNIRFIVLDCSAKPPAVGNIVSYTGTYSTSGGLSGCPGAPIGFSVDLKSAAGSVLFASDNKSLLPGSPSITYSNQNTDSIRAIFNWTPPASLASKTKTYYLSFNVKDSTCSSSMPAIVNSAIVIPITIWGKPAIVTDTSICIGKTAILTATGGGNYTWSVVSGTPGSLSCTTCTTAIATPNVTSIYKITSGISAFCGNNLDSVTVTVQSPLTPGLTITASPGNTIKAGTTVTFTAYPVNCTTPVYTWKRNGTPVSTGATFTTSTLSHGDVISCDMTCGDICVTSTSETKSLNINIIPSGIEAIHSNSSLNIIPNPNNGTFILQTGNINSGSIEIHNAVGQTIFSGEISATNKEIDLKNAPKGIYVLTLKSQNNTITTKFVIQ